MDFICIPGAENCILIDTNETVIRVADGCSANSDDSQFMLWITATKHKNDNSYNLSMARLCTNDKKIKPAMSRQVANIICTKKKDD